MNLIKIYITRIIPYSLLFTTPIFFMMGPITKKDFNEWFYFDCRNGM
jgi:hypothetical protein